MAQIKLTNGMYAIVDAEDVSKVIGLTWTAYFFPTGVYAQNNKDEHKLLHRFVLDAKKGTIVDHKNGNGLDCRKENLQIVTRSVNNARRRHCSGTNPFVGVTWDESRQKWKAQLKVSGTNKSLGRYPSAEEANQAIQDYRRQYLPETSVV